MTKTNLILIHTIAFEATCYVELKAHVTHLANTLRKHRHITCVSVFLLYHFCEQRFIII